MPGRRSQGESSRRRRRRRARSRSARAELSFSVSHMERLLREGRYAQRVNWSTPIFLAAVIQYMTAKVLELAGDEAQKTGRRCITPALLDMAVHNNSLLCDFFRSTIFSQVAPPWD